jgi:hypothetical protein
LKEALQTGHAKPEDFSIRELAVATCGERWHEAFLPGQDAKVADLLEAGGGDANDVTAFADINNQIIFTKVFEAWQNASKVADEIFDTVPSQFTGEKFGGISNIKELSKPIGPGMPYPEASVGERYVTAPASVKKGIILSLTKEAVFFDRTGQLLHQAQEVGDKLGYQKEIMCLNVLLGITNNYNLNGTSYSSYNQSPNANWVNYQTGNPLVDYTSINTAEVLASQILDPDTQLPIEVQLKNLFCMKYNLFNARRIVGATSTENIWPAFATSDSTAPGNVKMVAPSPVQPLSIHSSNIAYQLLINNGVSATTANNTWFIGDFKKALRYVQNWPLEVTTAPPGNTAEFERDIVYRWKASEQGVAMMYDPRYIFQFSQ